MPLPARQHWHPWHTRPRLTAALAIGVLSWVTLPGTLGPSARALLAWDLGAAVYLVLAWLMMARATVAHMKTLARTEDDGAATVLFLTVAASVASLAAIAAELVGLSSGPQGPAALHLTLVVLTFLASWLLVHTAFALHYAHAYWAGPGLPDSPPLAFPGPGSPVYTDFLYFAAVIGMTSQTADVAVCNTRMRRLVMAHGAVAFLFNTTLLALTVNAAAGLLH
jgi:uncharacterized membrane protein